MMKLQKAKMLFKMTKGTNDAERAHSKIANKLLNREVNCLLCIAKLMFDLVVQCCFILTIFLGSLYFET